MTPPPPPRSVTIVHDGERQTFNGRVASIFRGLLLAIPDIEAAKGEAMRITIHCGAGAEDVTVELPKKYYVSRLGRES